jgi:hypothetical protein
MSPGDRWCKAIKCGGGRCSNKALDSSEYCYAHSPEKAVERRANATAGGYARSRRSPNELEKLKKEIRTVTGAVLSGKVEKGAGAVVLQGYNTILRLIEVQRKLDYQRELEEQIKELHTRMEEIRRKRQWAG